MTRLEEVGEGLWVAEGDIVSFFGFPYPTRSVVVRLDAGRLWVWSPIRLDEDLRREIDALGDVAHLVSPNKLHHLFLEAWKSAYPAARLWAPRSTIARFRELEFAGVLADSPRPNGAPTSIRRGFADRSRWTRSSSFIGRRGPRLWPI